MVYALHPCILPTQIYYKAKVTCTPCKNFLNLKSFRVLLFFFFFAMTGNQQCQQCIESFVSNYQLKKHLREMHQVTCTVGGLVIHRIDLMFKCPLCDKTFSNPEYLRKHYKTHLKKIDQSVVLNHEPEKEVYQSIALTPCYPENRGFRCIPASQLR